MNAHATPNIWTRAWAAIVAAWHDFWRRRPLRHRATWALIIGGIGAAGIQLGIEELVEISQLLEDFLTAVWSLFVTIGFVERSERQVTPVSDPRSDQGAPLVEYEQDPIP